MLFVTTPDKTKKSDNREKGNVDGEFSLIVS